MQYEDFLEGHPSWYYSRPSTLNFRVLVGSDAKVQVSNASAVVPGAGEDMGDEGDQNKEGEGDTPKEVTTPISSKHTQRLKTNKGKRTMQQHLPDGLKLKKSFRDVQFKQLVDSFVEKSQSIKAPSAVSSEQSPMDDPVRKEIVVLLEQVIDAGAVEGDSSSEDLLLDCSTDDDIINDDNMEFKKDERFFYRSMLTAFIPTSPPATRTWRRQWRRYGCSTLVAPTSSSLVCLSQTPTPMAPHHPGLRSAALDGVLSMMEMAPTLSFPVVLFSYFGPIMRRGAANLTTAAKAARVQHYGTVQFWRYLDHIDAKHQAQSNIDSSGQFSTGTIDILSGTDRSDVVT
ncbi:hypothetical protein ABZP36_018159 [Zizania latifolia]